MLAFGVAAVCVRLGFWQLDRLQERRASNQRITAGLEAPITALAPLLAGSQGDPAYRRVHVEGTYLVEHELFAYGRPLDGRAGDHVLTPLRVAPDGPDVLVDRGWVPFDAQRSAPATDAAPPAGPVSIVGVVLPAEPGEAFPEGEGTSVRAIDPVAIGASLDLDLAPWYVVLQGQRPTPGPLPVPARLPALDEGPHLSYAIQWFSFAAIALVGYVLLARRGRAAAGCRGRSRGGRRVMGCLFVLISLITPRLVLFVLWIFTDYLSMAFGGWFWATLGFFVMPTTTIAYAVAKNDLSTATGNIEAAGVVIIVIGVAIDLGLFGGAAKRRRTGSAA